MTRKNVLFISLVVLMTFWGVSCSNVEMMTSTAPKEVVVERNDVSNVEIVFDVNQGRSWTIAKYKVKAVSGNVVVEGESTSAAVKLALTAGTWQFIASGYDSNNLLIYKGAFTDEISTSSKNITITMIKKSGNLTIDLTAYKGDASNVSYIEVVASRDTFDSVSCRVNSFDEKATFTGLAGGVWSINVNAVNNSGAKTTLGTESCEVVCDAVVNAIAKGNQLLTTATPKIIPISGTYEDAQTVTIECTENAKIYYTIDGSTPTASSKLYSNPMYLTASTTIKAIAIADGKKASNVATSVITIRAHQETIKNKIIVHAYAYTHIWAWIDGKNYTGGNWPGATMEAENGSWYTYTLDNLAKCNVIFSNSGSSQTADLSITEGEYWYKNSKWYEANPDDSEAPVLVDFTSDKTGTVSENVTFTVSATDNASLKKADLTANGQTIGSIKLSGKSGSGSLVWDTTKVGNGSYTVEAIVSDEAGNPSSKKTISLSTSNTFEPEAVITGASRAKFNSEKQFSASNSKYLGGTISSYLWTVTGGATLGSSSSETVTITFPGSKTTCKVTLKITTNDGKSATVSQDVEVVDGSNTGDFREETIYFAMTTRFYDGDKTNNEYCWDEGGEYLKYGAGDCAWRGDFQGLIQKLDYIKALGFSAIWITPVVVNSSGIDYHGYHAYDFSHVDPRYATKAQRAQYGETAGDVAYQELIDAAHSKGIKIIQDIVLNHTGNFGEKNLFPMFKRDTVPYVNADIALPSGSSWVRSQFYNPDPSGSAYSKLMAGLSMAGGSDYATAKGAVQYAARINAMKEDTIDTDHIYHHAKMIDWNSENCQLGQMAGDCVDLNTENPTVFKYLTQCYTKYIEMGVDGFRIDTVKHISRLTFNKEFIPAFKEAGGENFFIFGETCARYRGRWNEGVPALSPSFYTWKETDNWAWSQTDAKSNSEQATAHFAKYRSGFDHPAWADGTANHLLKNGRTYHEPDYSMRSGLDQIDFPMHWAFNSAGDAFQTAVGCNDPDFNDATWNVTYVDSHDYAPDNAPESKRFTGSWPDKMNLLWTFRGIPCIYYGSEIEFQKGMEIDPASSRTSLEKSGRAYFGDNIEGSVSVSDYGVYTNPQGAMATTLSNSLAQHVRRLNLIRRAVRALQKGQYSVEGCSGNIAFKRGYKNPGDSEFSFACVAINGGATFSGLPGGTYTEVITGNKVTVSDGGSITSDSIGENNMRVYVLQSDVIGKIGETGAYLK